MSISGRNGKVLRKVDLVQSKSLVQGLTKVVFYHKADLGDEGINLGALVMPTEVSSLGETNPSSSRLLEARLFANKANLTLVSSFRGILQKGLSYRVTSNSQIVFVGFTAEDGEIFTGTIDSNSSNSLQVIDAKQQTSEGDLDDTETDFAIGFSTRTGREEVLVTRNGLVQKRNTNNSDTVLDGNYYIVDAGNGYGSVVRFNVAAVGTEYVKVTSLGNIVESPTDSTWDEIEKLQGQIDKLVEVVAVDTGLPETEFQAAPNNVDLRAFGDRVLGLEEPGSPGVPKVSTISTPGAQLKNRIQTKILAADVTTNGTIAGLTFNNLIIGNWYEVTGSARLIIDSSAADPYVDMFAVHNGSNIHRVAYGVQEDPADTLVDQVCYSISFKFQATNTSLTFSANSASSASYISGDGTRSNTYIQLEERNDLEETSAFT
jgi:hypothetical protein